MYVHRSNHAETLVDVLATLVARPLADAAAAECIVVQGRGMERWLSMELARRLGVWANPRFPFPRKLLEDAIAAVLGADGTLSPSFAPETMLWSIADLLPQHLPQPAFAPIRRYLADDERGVKCIQLAERIANTFDQYVVYRPQMVLGWETGAGSDWQALLWRALVTRLGSRHIAARAAAFLTAIETRTTPLDGFPTRVSLFGISTLPPLYLELLAALSRVVEVHLFVLSPSQEYWADVRSQRDILRVLQKRHAGSADVDAALHLEIGHPLLASLGRLGRDFQCVLEGIGDYVEDDADLYHDPGSGSMLAALQSDILRLWNRGAAAEPLSSVDDSIRIHACHGPMREVEVLHDQLVALFDADRGLQPHEVAVMSPAIDTYAPFIEAVFGGEHTSRPRIPYRIADRRVRATEAVADAFTRVLDLLRSRMIAPEVLDLIAIDAVRERFGIAADEIDLLRTWVTQSGIRWGIDAAHRAGVGQPALDANTWRFGLDRLFLGYAMPGNERELYHDVLPYDDVEGSTAELLGRLAELCATLFSYSERLQKPRPLDAWRDDLGALLEAMVARTNQTAYQHQLIRSALAGLAERARAGGFEAAVDLDAVRAQLDAELERGAVAHGFLSGGVTFCALVPMRTIPFRVICLLGMNDDAFPRARRPLGFDLMAQHPLPGDRSARDDDRYLFLESLLSARERLLITYVGQSINDNSVIPPSVVVSELLDVLGAAFQVVPEATPPRADTSAAAPRSQLELFGGGLQRPIASGSRRAEPAPRGAPSPVVVHHPLQPFSPRYFGASMDDRLFSYAQSYCDGAQALVRPRQEHPAFLSGPLPLDSAAPRAVAIDELVRFFEHPVRAFLQRRLELRLGDDAEVVEDREPLELNNLEQWQIADALLVPAIEGADLRAAFTGVRASGRLPLGVLGQCTFDHLRPQIEAIAASTVNLLDGGRLPPLEVDYRIDDEYGTHITGLLRDVWPAGQIRWQYSKLGGRHELGLWIRHVILNCVAPPEYPRATYLLGRPAKDGSGVVHFRRVDDAPNILRDLLRLYWLGQTIPLPLFPKTSRTYAEARRGRGDAARALEAAQKRWAGSEQDPGDADDAYVQQVFSERGPFDPALGVGEGSGGLPASFREIAVTVFDPLLDHREDA